jgi:putative SOS response-associated peptidase YedK
MCGRFASHRSGEELRRAFATVGTPPPVAPNWNVSAGQQVMVVRLPPDTKQRRLDQLRWGFIPAATTDIKTTPKPINAAAEGAPNAPIFREALTRRRCIVPADAYYDWQVTPGGKLPHAIARIDGDPLAMAGVWERWKSPSGAMMLTFAILTTKANDTVGTIGGRMPVILEPRDWPLWLGETEGDPLALLRPAPPDIVYAWRVGPDVNDYKTNGPELLDPVEAAQTQQLA